MLAAADGTVTEYDYNEDDGYYLVLYHGMDDGSSWAEPVTATWAA